MSFSERVFQVRSRFSLPRERMDPKVPGRRVGSSADHKDDAFRRPILRKTSLRHFIHRGVLADADGRAHEESWDVSGSDALGGENDPILSSCGFPYRNGIGVLVG